MEGNSSMVTNSTYYGTPAAPAAVAGLVEEADAWIWATIFLVILFPTAVAMMTEAWLFYTHVEIAHPMYAVLMQECVALATIAWCTFGSLVAAFWAPKVGIAAVSFLTSTGMQIHQSSWFVITVLR